MNRLLVAIGILASLSLSCVTSSPLAQVVYPDSLRAVRGVGSFDIISDTQSPLWFEKLALRADNNELATQIMLAEIARDTSCAALFHLGDITGASSDDGQWETFDRESARLREAGIPIYPALGNHEYLFTGKEGVWNVRRRFSFLKRDWYCTRIGSTAIVLLNSNIGRLSPRGDSAQGMWYATMLDSLDADPAVSAVVVGCHHSPYTNSTIVDPSRYVQDRFVPPFMRSKKAILFVTGHSHAFEHFKYDGKDFLVIGGGGGLLHPLRRGSRERWHDEVVHADRRSFFHYMHVVPRPDRLNIEIMALLPGQNRCKKIYELEIPFAQ